MGTRDRVMGDCMYLGPGESGDNFAAEMGASSSHDGKTGRGSSTRGGDKQSTSMADEQPSGGAGFNDSTYSSLYRVEDTNKSPFKNTINKNDPKSKT